MNGAGNMLFAIGTAPMSFIFSRLSNSAALLPATNQAAIAAT